MKQVFHKLLSLIMAFVVLFSTMSFTIDMHYCGDTLVDTSVFAKATSCGMEIENSSSTSDCSTLQIDCCSSQQIVKDSQEELQPTIAEISFEQKAFITSFIYTYTNLFEGLDKNVSSYEGYNPPVVINQIYKIDETYLI
mgnify:CR=1 FL=1